MEKVKITFESQDSDYAPVSFTAELSEPDIHDIMSAVTGILIGLTFMPETIKRGFEEAAETLKPLKL